MQDKMNIKSKSNVKKLIKSSDCTGCGVCEAVCPVNAVNMTYNDKGFYEPSIDRSKCIGCGKCNKVCPVCTKAVSKYDNVLFYGLKYNDTLERISSSSGGAFTALAKPFLETGGIVWGAEFNDNFEVTHNYITCVEDIPKIRRSKYVQSNLFGVYTKILNQLQSKKKVLFVGTPCQVSALHNYIPETYRTELTLVEIVCHGVPSPGIWKEYLKCLSKKTKHEITDIKNIYFKFKDDKYSWLHPGFSVCWNDGFEYKVFSNETWYERGFLNNLFIRESCFNCKFKCLNSPADLIIGDFWGGQDIAPELYDKNGVSIVVAKSVKGEKHMNNLLRTCQYKNISGKDAVKYNDRMIIPAIKNINSKKFWKYYYDNKGSEDNFDGYEQIVKTLSNENLFVRVAHRISRKVKKLNSISKL